MRDYHRYGVLARQRLRAGARVGFEVGVGTAKGAMRDRVHGLAAEASFWTMMSMPPLLLALLALIGQLGSVIGADTSGWVARSLLDWADGVFTDRTMQEIVEPLVLDTLREGHSGLLSLGVVLALWSGSAAISSYVSAVTTAYELGGLRSFWRSRLLSLAMYLAGLVIGAVLLPLIVIGPGILGRLLARISGSDLSWLVTAAYWPAVVALSLVAITSLYHLAVPVRTRWRKDLPGAVLALLIWVLSSVGLRLYLGSDLRGDAGPAAAPIAVLLFFFLTALAVLIGAEFNATIDDRWPEPETEEGRRSARERQAEGEGRRRPSSPAVR
ncbi:YihY/virulence factor BrkB family protein [Micromonospora sp. WMMD1128]|uniref:YihY/virulence factor BrkB family protein n=1 Tax=Micromonospora sp. WMMD1128 TaxID=3015150 RepID=UPI00248B3AE5|nr:YihY/virulence factor BrkB family protein [Micromonospora sp. WMMD1128]WBB72079.1 YihY/virulence factor BrkB family protein [Micromonospora sp. WMMD1128]